MGFNSLAKLASRPRMRVLPYLGSIFYCLILLYLWFMDLALRPYYRLKYKKNLPDAAVWPEALSFW